MVAYYFYVDQLLVFNFFVRPFFENLWLNRVFFLEFIKEKYLIQISVFWNKICRFELAEPKLPWNKHLPAKLANIAQWCNVSINEIKRP
jgi:hypothetical protein